MPGTGGKESDGPKAGGGLPLPPWLFRFGLNPLMRLVLRTRLHAPISQFFLLLKFRGRKTGKEYTIPVGYQQRGKTLEILTEGGWSRNLVGGVPVRVCLRGRDVTGQAALDEDLEEIGQALGRMREAWGDDFLERRFGIPRELVAKLSPSELAENASQKLVRVELDCRTERSD